MWVDAGQTVSHRRRGPGVEPALKMPTSSASAVPMWDGMRMPTRVDGRWGVVVGEISLQSARCRRLSPEC
jgi:hypothetical protein